MIKLLVVVAAVVTWIALIAVQALMFISARHPKSVELIPGIIYEGGKYYKAAGESEDIQNTADETARGGMGSINVIDALDLDEERVIFADPKNDRLPEDEK